MTPLAEAAWRSCNYVELHKALGLSPPETSPLPHEVTALGCYQGEPTAWMSSEQHRDWRQAAELQRQLLDAYRLPDTEALEREYRKNLDEDKEMMAHYESQQDGEASLQNAHDQVAFREQLLEDLVG